MTIYKLFQSFVLCITLTLQAKHAAILQEEFIFQKPPFASCHASTLAETASGKLLCAYFGGTEEGNADVAIWLSVLEKGKWETPRKIAAAEHVACWNPVLFTTDRQEILLFYKVGRSPQTWSGVLKRSLDEGESWLLEEDLPAGVLGPIKNKPLFINGSLLCGSSMESWKRWGCWIDMTSDGGRTWTKSTPINVEAQLFGIIQPTLFQGQGNTIKLLARSHQIGAICKAESQDGGKTWSTAKAINLPNPNSGLDAVKIDDHQVILIYNHSEKSRYPLNLALSPDDGETWEMKLILEDDPGEYSYPSVIQTADGKVHITYTWNRTNIKHVVIDPHLL